MKPQDVTDRQTEKGIGITNILLTLLLLVSGTLGGMIITSMDSMEQAINKLNVTTGVTVNEIKHLHEVVGSHDERITILENRRD